MFTWFFFEIGALRTEIQKRYRILLSIFIFFMETNEKVLIFLVSLFITSNANLVITYFQEYSSISEISFVISLAVSFGNPSNKKELTMHAIFN